MVYGFTMYKHGASASPWSGAKFYVWYKGETQAV